MKITLLSLCLSLFFFLSCKEEKESKIPSQNKIEIKIPDIEKDIKDPLFSIKNGVLFYNNDLYSGVVNEFYNDGTLKSSSEYYLGKREGRYFGYYPNKNKWFQRFYSNNIKVKTHIGWYENGSKMFEYQFNNLGAYHGFVKDWHNNGQLAKHFNFLNGKEEGSQKMWLASGKIRANFFTTEGERFGLIGLKKCYTVKDNQ